MSREPRNPVHPMDLQNEKRVCFEIIRVFQPNHVLKQLFFAASVKSKQNPCCLIQSRVRNVDVKCFVTALVYVCVCTHTRMRN